MTIDSSINVILTHKNGVYVATAAGQILCLDMMTSSKEDKDKDSPKLVSSCFTEEKFVQGTFSMYYDRMVLRTQKVRGVRTLPPKRTLCPIINHTYNNLLNCWV